MSDSLYSQVARELVEGIRTGRYPVGSQLPTEMALCEHFGASRHTVRAALRELQDLGLISRRKKAGTRVESATPVSRYRNSIDSVDDLVHFGVAHRRLVRDVREILADRALAQRIGGRAGKRWLRFSSLRMEGDADTLPIGWTDVYVDPAFRDLIPIVRKEPETLISTLIETRYGRRITEIRQDVRGILIPEALAAELRADAGSPALEVIRRYLDQAGETIEISISVHPAERFAVSTRLTRERA